MFGVSFLEVAVIGLIALIVVGPQKLPTMMRTLGEWLGKLRRLTSDMRAQTGIDDILREEGIDGVVELRNLLRGTVAARPATHSTNMGNSRYSEAPDASLEFPVEGADASGAMPEDLFLESSTIEKSSNENSGDENSSKEDKVLESISGAPNASTENSEPATQTSAPVSGGTSEGSASSEVAGTPSQPPAPSQP